MRKAILISCLVLIVAAISFYFLYARISPLPIAKTVAATQPASRPTTRRATPPTVSYMELMRSENPAIATTQPLAFALELSDAAHLIVHDPVYLDPSGHLWITRSDGAQTSKALGKPIDDTEHVIRDKPVFVHWWINDSGEWVVDVVTKAGQGYDLVTKTDRRHLCGDRPFQWDRAFSVMGKIVVPTNVGISVMDVDPQIQEHYHVLPGCTPAGNPPVAIPDTRGILAWAPWESNRPGSNGISRFVDGSWTDLSTDQWPARPVQLSILRDGSVLGLCVNSAPTTLPTATPVDPDGGIASANIDQPELTALPDHINISIGQLEPAQIEQSKVDDLVKQLDNDDGEIRQAAFEELSRYGPALAPMLEKLVDHQKPEAQTRIRQLLRIKLTPALGGMMAVDGRLSVARRYADGTVLFFAPAGVQVPTDRDEPDTINPAWITQRPDGRMDRPLPASLVRDQKPDACTLMPMRDEWLISDDAGPRRFFGNAFEPLLSSAELRFSKLLGIAQHRRWLFADPHSNDTLIIDPLVADPTPKLPVWTIAVGKGDAGWDRENFPAVDRGEGQSSWALADDSWKVLPSTEKVTTQSTPVDSPAQLSASLPTTQNSLGSPLLIASDGTRYFDGQNALVVMKPDGRQTRWSLPGTAVGTSDPVLMQTLDGILFLYNQPGRLLRIKPTPDGAEPFTLEATFTHDIPDAEHPIRIWLDPAGRIDWIGNSNALSVMFPSGHIPKPIANMMLDARP